MGEVPKEPVHHNQVEREHRNQTERERHSQAGQEHHILAEQQADSHLAHHNRVAQERQNCYVADKGL